MNTFVCLFCGSEQIQTPRKKQFCNHKCSKSFRSIPLKELFWSGQSSNIARTTIRRYLSEIRGYICSVCGISEWNSLPITLQVDHIDGNAGNNNPTNVRLICPNCHSQTATFGGGNKGKGRKARGLNTN